ncbi:MAG: hypothetical protein EHM17_05985 [Verrucomicrobiaceae bacterium]|nr:MAG: hypothetical protein EHM17_05985 [Verrucomicrobiaceae bacterium]
MGQNTHFDKWRIKDLAMIPRNPKNHASHGRTNLRGAAETLKSYMKRPHPLNEGARFSGQLRYYHRSGVKDRRTWEEWVDNKGTQSGSLRKWLKIAVIALALLALGAIVAALVIAFQ